MFRSWKAEPFFWIFVRSVLGAAWLYLGAEKLFRIQSFIDDISNYAVVHESWTGMLGHLVAWLEIVVGLSLMLRLMYPGGLLLSGGLLATFVVALSQAWARGLEISCGCTPWAAEEKTNYPLGIGINVALLVVTAVLGWVEINRPRHRFRGRKLELGSDLG